MTVGAANVWITGASRGIGAALAREYTRAGAHLALSARPSAALDAVVERAGEETLALPGDLTQREAVLDAVQRQAAADRLPDLTILNAGTYAPMGMDDFDAVKVRELFALNLFSVADALEALMPRLRARGHGHVAVIGSVAGDIGLPYAGPYSASKAAVNRLCQSLRPEFERAGLYLSVVNPGFVATPLTAKNDFPMPFLVTADRAARIIRQGLARRAAEIRFPLAMSVSMRLLTLCPQRLRAILTRRMLR